MHQDAPQVPYLQYFAVGLVLCCHEDWGAWFFVHAIVNWIEVYLIHKYMISEIIEGLRFFLNLCGLDEIKWNLIFKSKKILIFFELYPIHVQ